MRCLAILLAMVITGCGDALGPGDMVRLSVENNTGLPIILTEYRSTSYDWMDLSQQDVGWITVSTEVIPTGTRVDFPGAVPIGCWDFRVSAADSSNLSKWIFRGAIHDRCVDERGYTLRPY